MTGDAIFAPWMAKMRSRMGVHEISGPKDNPLIMEMYPYGRYPKEHDEVPWCACAVGWALITTGHKGSNSAAANSYMNYGQACELKPGCIVVIRHRHGPLKGHYHVTFCDHVVDQNWFAGLGGNQSNEINVSKFPIEDAVATRWPVRALEAA